MKFNKCGIAKGFNGDISIIKLFSVAIAIYIPFCAVATCHFQASVKDFRLARQ